MTDSAVQLQQASQERLKAIVGRIERLEEEKAGISADIKEIYAEAKSSGYNTKVLRKLIALRRVDKRTREEQDQILDLYLHAVGEI